MTPKLQTLRERRPPPRPAWLAAVACMALAAGLLVEPISPALAAGAERNEATAAANERDFKFYAIIHSNRDVDKLDYGFDANLPIVYAFQLWPEGADRSEPDIPYIKRRLSDRFGSDLPERLIVNVEHWPVGIKVSPDARAESIRKYAAVLDAVREVLPQTKIALYSIVPIREYWVPVRGKSEHLTAWDTANRQLAQLADHVDFIAPSLYTFYRDQENWKRYAEANIRAARRYGKPAYPFLWPLYHVSNRVFGGTLIEREYFNAQLELVHEIADGVIVWNGPYERWALPMAWFEETKQTIERLRQK